MSKNHVDFSNTGGLSVYKVEPFTPPAMSDIETKLREALDGVTPGPWVCIENDEDSFDYDKLHISTDERVYKSKGPIAEINIGYDDPFETEQRRSAEFIALCSPDNIGALLDTIAALRKQVSDAVEALRPFVTFADIAVEKLDDGWVWKNLSNDRIRDWFGPSDFGLLQHFAAALAQGESSNG